MTMSRRFLSPVCALCYTLLNTLYSLYVAKGAALGYKRTMSASFAELFYLLKMPFSSSYFALQNFMFKYSIVREARRRSF